MTTTSDQYSCTTSRHSLLAEASFPPGTMGGGAKGNAQVTFNVVPTGGKLKLSAMSYCTKHGLWESDPVVVEVH